MILPLHYIVLRCPPGLVGTVEFRENRPPGQAFHRVPPVSKTLPGYIGPGQLVRKGLFFYLLVTGTDGNTALSLLVGSHNKPPPLKIANLYYDGWGRKGYQKISLMPPVSRFKPGTPATRRRDRYFLRRLRAIALWWLAVPAW
jgi:hypothetical protein